MSNFEKILAVIKENDEVPKRLLAVAIKAGLVLLVSYLVASTLTAFSVTLLADRAMTGTRAAGTPSAGGPPEMAGGINHVTMRRTVVARNVFNSEGQVPDESDPTAEDATRSEFDANAPCRKTTLPVELVGTIYLGSSTDSVATVREKGFGEADVYRAGDRVIGYDDALIYAIEPQRVIVNNNGAKECLELASTPPLKAASPGDSSAVGASPVPTPSPEASGDCSGTSSYALEGPYVEQSLGPGFAKILDSGRLVPHNEDNRMVGFKLIGVRSGSLFTRIGLASGDVITRVNDASMAEPDQGFALYQALQDAREIRVDVLKNGKTPCNLTIEIR